jgi:LmbE family N-acetylglucosaminyl deacetylase
MTQTNSGWKPRIGRLFRSITRILFLLVTILSLAYWWNPQKIHYPQRQLINSPRVDPDLATLISPQTRITVVVGHPDDAEFFISGTLLKLKGQITLIVVTDGDKSYYPPFTTNVHENRRVRRLEQTTASASYHAKVIFLGGPDGRYDPDEPAIRDRLKQAMNASKPDYIIAFESEYVPTIQHRDHENSGKATLELASQTSAKWALLFATNSPNFYFDTTGTWTKREELLAVHASQFYGEKLERVKGFVMSKAENEGEIIGTETAEAFRAIKLKP